MNPHCQLINPIDRQTYPHPARVTPNCGPVLSAQKNANISRARPSGPVLSICSDWPFVRQSADSASQFQASGPSSLATASRRAHQPLLASHQSINQSVAKHRRKSLGWRASANETIDSRLSVDRVAQRIFVPSQSATIAQTLCFLRLCLAESDR